jgi:hypothetical protein
MITITAPVSSLATASSPATSSPTRTHSHKSSIVVAPASKLKPKSDKLPPFRVRVLFSLQTTSTDFLLITFLFSSSFVFLPSLQVLVHDEYGQSRAPTVILAYLMALYRWPLKNAYTFLERLKSATVINPNRSLLDQLALFEKALQIDSSQTPQQQSDFESQLMEELSTFSPISQQHLSPEPRPSSSLLQKTLKNERPSKTLVSQLPFTFPSSSSSSSSSSSLT